MKTEFPIVIVEWIDSCSDERTWLHRNEISNTLSYITTVGFLVTSDKKAITIAMGCGSTTNFHGNITIPRCSIHKMRKIKV